MDKKKILVVEDEKAISDILVFNLQREGYNTLAAYDGEGLRCALEEAPDLILLDVMLPEMDGFEVCRRVRAEKDTPIIMLTAREEETDKVMGLELGADDYITKPFHPLEVTARVKSQLRRYLKLGGGVQNSEVYTIGGIELRDKEKEVYVDGNQISLTPKEFEILKLFLANPGKVFSPKEIYAEVWKEKPIGTDNAVAVHIRHIREKIEINPAEPRYLKVVFGQGYKLEKGRKS